MNLREIGWGGMDWIDDDFLYKNPKLGIFLAFW
jgi:hypothetical protein